MPRVRRPKISAAAAARRICESEVSFIFLSTTLVEAINAQRTLLAKKSPVLSSGISVKRARTYPSGCESFPKKRLKSYMKARNRGICSWHNRCAMKNIRSAAADLQGLKLRLSGQAAILFITMNRRALPVEPYLASVAFESTTAAQGCSFPNPEKSVMQCLIF